MTRRKNENVISTVVKRGCAADSLKVTTMRRHLKIETISVVPLLFSLCSCLERPLPQDLKVRKLREKIPIRQRPWKLVNKRKENAVEITFSDTK